MCVSPRIDGGTGTYMLLWIHTYIHTYMRTYIVDGSLPDTCVRRRSGEHGLLVSFQSHVGGPPNACLDLRICIRAVHGQIVICRYVHRWLCVGAHGT